MSLSPIDQEAEYRGAVLRSLQAAMRAGYRNFHDVLRRCEGADPVSVAELLKHEPPIDVSTKGQSTAYELLSSLSRQLPAPDPFRSQWWFSSGGIAHLLNVIDARGALFVTPRILCLGTPTLSPYLLERNYRVEVLDIDKQVLDAIANSNEHCSTREYDASDDLPADLSQAFDLAVLDPPWYPELVYTFINRAICAVIDHGEILCTIPGRLTRLGIEHFRTELIKQLVNSGHEVLAVERGAIEYQVPRFELAALDRLADFRGIPWRSGDMLHVRKGSGAGPLPVKVPAKTKLSVFSRNPHEFRVFACGTAQAHGVSIKALRSIRATSVRARIPARSPMFGQVRRLVFKLEILLQ